MEQTLPRFLDNLALDNHDNQKVEFDSRVILPGKDAIYDENGKLVYPALSHDRADRDCSYPLAWVTDRLSDQETRDLEARFNADRLQCKGEEYVTIQYAGRPDTVHDLQNFSVKRYPVKIKSFVWYDEYWNTPDISMTFAGLYRDLAEQGFNNFIFVHELNEVLSTTYLDFWFEDKDIKPGTFLPRYLVPIPSSDQFGNWGDWIETCWIMKKRDPITIEKWYGAFISVKKSWKKFVPVCIKMDKNDKNENPFGSKFEKQYPQYHRLGFNNGIIIESGWEWITRNPKDGSDIIVPNSVDLLFRLD